MEKVLPKQNITPSLLLVIATLLLLTGSANAQVTLQNTTNSIQSQTGQAQNSANTQNQTGTLQQNNGQSALSQSEPQALEVLSDPKQIHSNTVVQPEVSRTNELKKQPEQDSRAYLFGSLFVIILLAGVAAYITSAPVSEKKPKKQTQPAPAKKPETKVIEPSPVAPKKKKQTRKQRKKQSPKK